MTLVLHHDSTLRQDNKGNQNVLVLKEKNVVTECLKQSKEEYGAQRVHGKQHPSKKAYKEIGWTLLWQLAANALELGLISAGIDQADADFHLQNIQIIQSNMADIPRFYPVYLQKREKAADGSNNNNKNNREEPAEQLWIVRIAKTTEGDCVAQAPQSMVDDDMPSVLLEAEYRPGRARRGSLARALAAILP